MYDFIHIFDVAFFLIHRRTFFIIRIFMYDFIHIFVAAFNSSRYTTGEAQELRNLKGRVGEEGLLEHFAQNRVACAQLC
jgi:hypothetical protein